MQEVKKIFHDYLAQQGLKSTRQREIILDEFLRFGSHPSTEDLYLKLRKKHPQIGYATVHRTLKLLAECGLAEGHNFGDGQTRYESCIDEKHHDHLVCTDCGAILEFYDPRIEKLQDEVARDHGFTIRNHRLELYGLCSKCTQKK
ncbi:transcriptional repressor [Desulfuromonas sp. KJ2020]|uniref:Fur family transcriptional regulator n=1 Tax=Desulfuromonas sp. KJ2020 TaxID=2919173 RepID=UPI0020A81B8E|nr:transcriptional repressor [Desulfuromonas sp. KJ2020]MCP3178032.1 transcriptional repressor [Desulfuromonas sp. KJ2020]